jgi:hypothetical protein
MYPYLADPGFGEMQSITLAQEDQQDRSKELLSDLGDEQLEEVFLFCKATSELPHMLPPMHVVGGNKVSFFF